MNIQNERIQELIDIVKQKDEAIIRLQGQITHSEEIIKDHVSLKHLNCVYTKKPQYVLVMDVTLENWSFV